MFEEYMGVIKALGFNFVPEDWGWCSGAELAINQYSALFSLLGCAYGGDCRVTFAVPDLRGRSPLGLGQGPGLPHYFVGQMPGLAHRVLSWSEMPLHTHPHQYTGGSGNDMTVHVADSGGKKPLPDLGDYIGAPANGLGTIAENLYIAAADIPPGTETPVGGVEGGTGGFFNELLTIDHTPNPTEFVDIVQPSQAVNYCICIEGLYPSRS